MTNPADSLMGHLLFRAGEGDAQAAADFDALHAYFTEAQERSRNLAHRQSWALIRRPRRDAQMAANANPACICGHTESQHDGPAAFGGAQCRYCPGDDERSWRHAFEAAPVPIGDELPF